MKMAMTIDYEVTDTDAETEALLEEVIAEEARGFVDTVRARLASEGVEELSVSVRETTG